MSMLDLTGKKFGRLTALCVDHIKYKEPRRLGSVVYWKCKCDCGKYSVVTTGALRGGKIKSCGCLQREMASTSNKTHGKSKSDIFKVWVKIKERCINKNCKDFKYYGGRGITICDEWKNDFMSFYNWAMNNGYKKGLSFERIDNNNGYSPSNCKMATKKEQANNTRRNVFIDYDGEKKTIPLWCDEFGCNQHLIRDRIFYNYNIQEAILIPKNKGKNYKKLITDINKNLKIKEYVMWHKKTFIKETLESLLKKLEEEISEYNQENNYEEMADIYIISFVLKMRFFSDYGILYFIKNFKNLDVKKLNKKLLLKMEINKNRKWSFIDGVYKHI